MSPMLVAVLRVLATLGLMLANGVVLIYMLRKVLGHLHIRLGPMHVGWHGVAQTTADVLKLLTKEDPTPRAVDKALFFIAPAAVFVPSLMCARANENPIPNSPRGVPCARHPTERRPTRSRAEQVNFMGSLQCRARRPTEEVQVPCQCETPVRLCRSGELKQC